MNDYPTCGIWPGRGRIAASVYDGDGGLHHSWMAPADEGECWDCLGYLERDWGLDLHLVAPESAPSLTTLLHAARDRRMSVVVAPAVLVLSIAAAALARPAPRGYANILARLPASRFRSQLRTLPPADPRQLALL